MPAPLTPPDCDLRDFPRMMIDITRLRQSAFDATPDDAAWRAGLNLWFSAWHSVPAGSLDADESALAKAAGLGRDVKTWRKVSAAALRGFVPCDDGRLYHETVCELVLEAWLEKLVQRLSSGAGNAKRWGASFDPKAIEAAIDHAAALLTQIAPQSKSIQKARRRHSRSQSQSDPDGMPIGSQEKGEGTGISREKAKPSLSGAGQPARETRGREEPLPEGFPDAEAIREAEGWIGAAGVVLDASAHAKRFANHARTKDRRERNWPAAWRGWIDIEIERAPAAAKPQPEGPVTWNGPDEIRRAVLYAYPKGADAYLRQYCTWREVPERALVVRSATIFAKLRDCQADLKAAGWALILEQEQVA